MKKYGDPPSHNVAELAVRLVNPATYPPFHNLPHEGPLQTSRMPAGLCFTGSSPLSLGRDCHSRVWSRLAGQQPQMTPSGQLLVHFLAIG